MGFHIPGSAPILEPKSSIILQRGLVYTTAWESLDDDPLCKFYAVSLFGNPPPSIHVGTTWHFGESANFGSAHSVNGTSTVTRLDAEKDIIALHEIMAWPARNESNPLISDLVVIEGGVIESESFSERNDLVDPNSKRVLQYIEESDRFTLSRP